MVARFLLFCGATQRNANKEMENALVAYMDSASSETKGKMTALRRKQQTDDAANTR